MQFPFRFRILAGCLAAVILAGQAASATADSPRDSRVAATDRPIFVLNVAGVDRVFVASDTALKLADRGELSLALRGAVTLSTGGLMGIDRKRPFGLMTYIDRGEVPDPVAVYYLPVSDKGDFTRLLKTVGSAKPVNDSDPPLLRIQIAESPWIVRIAGGYAFVAKNARTLKRKFPDPAKAFRAIAKRHDVAARFQFDAMPPLMKTMLLDYLRAGAANGAERRGGETAADHRYRVVLAETLLTGLNQALKQGQSLTLGLKVKTGDSAARLEASLAASPGSIMERGFRAMGGSNAVLSPTSSGKPHLRVNLLPDEQWKPLAAVLLGRLVNSGRQRDPVRTSIAQLAAFTWKSGLRFSLWQSAFGPRKVPVILGELTTPPTSTPAVGKLLSVLKKDGRIESLKSEVDHKNRVTWFRLKWKSGARDAAVSTTLAITNQSVWLAAGPGELKQTLLGQIAANAAKPARRRELKERTLLSFAIRLSEVTSLFSSSSVKDGDKRRDGIHMSVKLRGSELVAATTLEADVLAALLQQVFKTAARRIPALRRPGR